MRVTSTKFFLAALALVVAAACVVRTTPPEDNLGAQAWEYLCEVDKTYNCDGIVPPKVVRHDGINDYLGTLGFYFPGEPIVFVRKTMDAAKQEQTLVHEMAHYLQDVTGWNEYRVQSCEWESVAFRIADAWAVYVGRADLVRGPNWWRPYWQCQGYRK